MLNRILLAAWLAIVCVAPALATSVLPLGLAQVIDQSTTAFQATCIDNRSGRDPQTGFIVTMTTFRVDDVLKGDVPATYTIKQIGGEGTSENLNFKVHGVPKFVAGESYVLFMAGVSAAGFSSPIGLSQGRFTIQSGDSGPEVGNGRDFRDLTADMPGVQLPAQVKSSAAQDKPLQRIGLDDFKQIVRRHAGSKR
jgi:hypothetical protein